MSNATTQTILNEIRAMKEELINTIFASETRLLLKLEELNNRVSLLERNNQELQDIVENLERQVKQNNIIIYGLNEKSEVVTTEFVCNTLNRLLELDIREIDINNCYRLGKTRDCPIKVQFVSNIKKQLVLKNTRKLKRGTLAISQDLTSKQRSELKILRRHLVKSRGAGKKSFIKGNKLIIDGKSYTTNDLESDEEDIVKDISYRRGSSLPNTPTKELVRSESPEPAPIPSTSNSTVKIPDKPTPQVRAILGSMNLRSKSTSSSVPFKTLKRK